LINDEIIFIISEIKKIGFEESKKKKNYKY